MGDKVQRELRFKEVVLDIGVDGGAATIYRTPLERGGWAYHMGGTTIALDDDDNEEWRHWTRDPVPTLHDALEQVDKHGFWIYFTPCAPIHPEYRLLVWELLLRTAKQRAAEGDSNWSSDGSHARDAWHHYCFSPAEGRRHD